MLVIAAWLSGDIFVQLDPISARALRLSSSPEVKRSAQRLAREVREMRAAARADAPASTHASLPAVETTPASDAVATEALTDTAEAGHALALAGDAMERREADRDSRQADRIELAFHHFI